MELLKDSSAFLLLRVRRLVYVNQTETLSRWKLHQSLLSEKQSLSARSCVQLSLANEITRQAGKSQNPKGAGKSLAYAPSLKQYLLLFTQACFSKFSYGLLCFSFAFLAVEETKIQSVFAWCPLRISAD